MTKLQNLKPLLDQLTQKGQSWSISQGQRKIYQPYPKQILLHSSPAEETLYGGAAGGAKSYGLLWDAYIFCVRNPGCRVIMFRRTYPELEKSLIFFSRSLFTLRMGKYNEQKHRWEIFTSGTSSCLEFGHCKDESDVFAYQSASYDAMYFDELTHFTEFQFSYLLTRLRPNVPGLKCRVKCATNPGNIGHAWVRRRWRLWDRDNWFWVWRPDRTKEQPNPGTRCFLQSLVTDNKVLMKNDPSYIDRLRASPYAKQLLDGDWEIFSGQAFPELNIDAWQCEPFEIPEHWDRWRSLDFGFAAPFAGYWHTQNPSSGRVYTYRELYGAGIKETLQAKRMVSMSMTEKNNREKINFTVASWDIWGRRSDGSIASVYTRNGLHCIPGARDTIAGKMRVHDYIALAPDGKPWWQVFRGKCPNLVKTLPELILDSNNPEKVDTKGTDHAYDAIRYFFMSMPPRLQEVDGGQDADLVRLDPTSRDEWKNFRKMILRREEKEKAIGSGISEIEG